ncbi:MAG: LacI family DNA-binding transcriptional regulator [Chloroflexi bacterium]|nr:LacI family DNA-binding transcriptional regulator [Chloroflexota bacterium]
MSPTLHDVARKAGVSIKTVSRVVNKEKNVAEETRHQVLRVIDELGYVPHIQAQRLASGKTRSIVLHYPLSNPNLFSNQIEMNFITGIALGAADEEYYFTLMTGALTSAGLMRLCRGAQADGIVLMQIAMQDWRVELLRENEYPFVMIGRCENNTGLSFVDFDFESALIEAFTRLIDMGHRQIGFLTFPQEWRIKNHGGAMRAFQGFKSAIKRFNCTSLYRESELGVRGAYLSAKNLLEENPRLTAFVTVHNTLAVGAITALQEINRKVPDDCSIVGVPVGDESELIIPPLSGLEWLGHETGQLAAKMLIRKLNGTSPVPEQILVPPKWKLRHSTAQAPR